MKVATEDVSPSIQPESSDDPFASTLIGEYTRLILIGTAVLCAMYWATQIRAAPILALVMTLASIFILGATTTDRLAGVIRLSLSVGLAIGIVSVAAKNGTEVQGHPIFSPAAVLIGLGLLVLRDLVIAVRSQLPEMSYRALGLWLSILLAAVYLIVVPSLEAYLPKTSDDRPATMIDVSSELTTLESIRVRSSNLIVFAIFAYFGACIGSFLNVVAASSPHGESIVGRSSACPRCETPIRRIDNVPIFSYLNLQGQCRSCSTPIPFRYLAVELITATIFGSLFAYELITGAANVPGFRVYLHAGIVWMLLYPKWPVIGIYLFHCAMFCLTLMFALMEIDKLRCPRVMAVVIIMLFAGLAIAIPTLQPVAWDDQVPVDISRSMPSVATRVLTCLIGGGVLPIF